MMPTAKYAALRFCISAEAFESALLETSIEPATVKLPALSFALLVALALAMAVLKTPDTRPIEAENI